jgi:hypothetical protein
MPGGRPRVKCGDELTSVAQGRPGSAGADPDSGGVRGLGRKFVLTPRRVGSDAGGLLIVQVSQEHREPENDLQSKYN